MTSTGDLIEAMRVHRRFTLVGGGGLRGDSDGMWTTYRHLQERVVTERAACTELVRAAGCLCKELFLAQEYQREFPPPYDLTFNGDRDRGVHDPRCPAAIAAAIEARGVNPRTGHPFGTDTEAVREG